MNSQKTPTKPSAAALERFKQHGKLPFLLLALSILLIPVSAFCNGIFYYFFYYTNIQGTTVSNVLLPFMGKLFSSVLQLLPFLLLLLGLWFKKKWLTLVAAGLHVGFCFYFFVSLAYEFLTETRFDLDDLLDALLNLVPCGVAFLGLLGAAALFFTLLTLHKRGKFFPWILLLTHAGMTLVQLVYMLGQLARLANQLLELNLVYSLNYLFGAFAYLCACLSYLAFVLFALTVIKRVKQPQISAETSEAEPTTQENAASSPEKADDSLTNT